MSPPQHTRQNLVSIKAWELFPSDLSSLRRVLVPVRSARENALDRVMNNEILFSFDDNRGTR